MRVLGLVATVTPSFMHHATDRFGLDALGAAGTPIRALLDGGVPVALSTDGVPHSMLFAMWQALARHDADTGTTLGDSGLSRLEALRLPTVAGHVLSWDEDRRGPLAVGRDADFTVLADSTELPLTITNSSVTDITVIASVNAISGIVSIATPSQTVTIPAGSSSRVTVPMVSVANGKTSLRATLTTTSGIAVSEPVFVEIDVQAQWETITLVTFIGIVASIMGIGIARTIRDRRRRS
jgi:hypothetical protein